MFGPGSVLKLNQPDNSLYSNTSDYCKGNESLGSITHNPTSLKHKNSWSWSLENPTRKTYELDCRQEYFVVGHLWRGLMLLEGVKRELSNKNTTSLCFFIWPIYTTIFLFAVSFCCSGNPFWFDFWFCTQTAEPNNGFFQGPIARALKGFFFCASHSFLLAVLHLF